MIRSIVGSSARLVNSTVRCMAPLCKDDVPQASQGEAGSKGKGMGWNMQATTRTAHLLKVCGEEASSLHIYAHGAKHNRKVVTMVIHSALALHKPRLTANLRPNLKNSREYTHSIECEMPISKCARKRHHSRTRSWGKPAAENNGIFCPRAMEFMTSMALMPV